jgi:hypothetical protein
MGRGNRRRRRSATCGLGHQPYSAGTGCQVMRPHLRHYNRPKPVTKTRPKLARCRWCKSPFKPNPGGRPTLYCKAASRQRACEERWCMRASILFVAPQRPAIHARVERGTNLRDIMSIAAGPHHRHRRIRSGAVQRHPRPVARRRHAAAGGDGPGVVDGALHVLALEAGPLPCSQRTGWVLSLAAASPLIYVHKVPTQCCVRVGRGQTAQKPGKARP